jgi:hypothetical protein
LSTPVLPLTVSVHPASEKTQAKPFLPETCVSFGPMNDIEKQQRFVSLHEEGWSFAAIAESLQVR